MTKQKTKTTWLVQQTRNPTETVRVLEKACREQALPLEWVPIIPFSPEMPDLNAAPPFVFYGYTTLLINAWKSPRWRSGVFYDPDLFCPSMYQEKWGKPHMMSDFRFASLRDLHLWWKEHTSGRLFVKPNDDLKRFSGGVMDFAAFDYWFRSVETLEGGDVSPETVAAFAPPVGNIGPEFRVFLVEGRAIAASSYLPHGGVPPPPEVWEYAEARARDWQPAPVFVLDVAYFLGEEASPLRIVEANCFNGSSFYRADTGAIVRAVSLYQEARG